MKPERIVEIFKGHDIDLTDEQAGKIKGFVELFANWNKKVNISGLKSCEDIVKKLIADTLLGWSIIKGQINISDGGRILDLGAGGGVVSIPVCIMEEKIDFYLLESNRKKCYVLEDMKKKLDIGNMSIINKRAENLGRDHLYRESFSAVLVKAVARIQTLIELSFPLIRVQGSLFAYKNSSVVDELRMIRKSLKVFYGEIRGITPYSTDKNNVEYNSIIIHVRKLLKTDEAYPRRAGVAQRKPII